MNIKEKCGKKNLSNERARKLNENNDEGKRGNGRKQNCWTLKHLVDRCTLISHKAFSRHKVHNSFLGHIVVYALCLMDLWTIEYGVENTIDKIDK